VERSGRSTAEVLPQYLYTRNEVKLENISTARVQAEIRSRNLSNTSP